MSICMYAGVLVYMWCMCVFRFMCDIGLWYGTVTMGG